MKNKIPLTKDQANSGNFGTIFNRENKSGNILERLPEVKSTIEFEPKFLSNSIGTKELKDFCLPCCYKKSKEDSEIEKRKMNVYINTKIKLKQQGLVILIKKIVHLMIVMMMLNLIKIFKII